MEAFPDRAPHAIVLTASHVDSYLPTRPDSDVAGHVDHRVAGRVDRRVDRRVETVNPAAFPRRPEAVPFWADMITSTRTGHRTSTAGSAPWPAPPTQDSAAAGTGSPAPTASSTYVDPTAPVPGADLARSRDVPDAHAGQHDAAENATENTAGAGADGGILVLPDFAPPRTRRADTGRWELVVVELGCRLADDRLGLLGADMLAPGGILAVLTHSERHGGRLVDPTGSVVASAQAADLLYLQHIVLLTHPVDSHPIDAAPPANADGPATAGTGVSRDEVVDLLLFVQPGDDIGAGAAADPTGAAVASHAASPRVPAPDLVSVDARAADGDRA